MSYSLGSTGGGDTALHRSTNQPNIQTTTTTCRLWYKYTWYLCVEYGLNVIIQYRQYDLCGNYIWSYIRVCFGLSALRKTWANLCANIQLIWTVLNSCTICKAEDILSHIPNKQIHLQLNTHTYRHRTNEVRRFRSFVPISKLMVLYAICGSLFLNKEP